MPNDPKLMAVIASIESSGNLYAVRFEEALYLRLQAKGFPRPIVNKIVNANACSRATGEVIYCTSFGKYQIMGFNLYDPVCCDMRSAVGFYFSSMSMQESSYNKYISVKRINYNLSDLIEDKAKRGVFAISYNGSIAYADKIMAHAKALGFV